MKLLPTKLLSAFHAVVLRVMRPCVQLKSWLRQHPVKMQVSELMMRTRREGEYQPPFWYGHAYSRWDAMIDVYYPIPLNYIVQWGMWVSHKWNRWRGRWSWVDKQVMAIEHRECESLRRLQDEVRRKEHLLDDYLRRAEMALLRAGATTQENESHGA